MILNKKQRIENLINELENLPHSEFPPEHILKNDFYPFSNEKNLSEPIQKLKTIAPEFHSEEVIRIAVLIGQSSICSIIPELALHSDLIVFADINPFLISHVRKLLDLLKSSPSMAAFNRAFNDEMSNDPVFERFNASAATPNLDMRKKTLKK